MNISLSAKKILACLITHGTGPLSQTGNLLQTFPNPTPAAVDGFGESVAAAGSNVLVGAPRDNTAANDARGRLFVRRRATLPRGTRYRHPQGLQMGSDYYRATALDEGKEEMLDPEGWFASYENYANKYAELAEDLGIDLFAIGSELHDAFLQGHDNEWTSIINGVRARYSGPLFFTIAGNSFLKNGNNVSFWDELDYIGINAYSKLTIRRTDCIVTGCPQSKKTREKKFYSSDFNTTSKTGGWKYPP